jgi:hypothetical protein
MKKAIAVFCFVIALQFFNSPAKAEEKQKARISLIRQTGNTVALTVSSPHEFYVGGNKHILYIGGKHFDLYEQNNEDGRGYLKFFIPADDFKMIKDGTRVYLSYGELEIENEDELEALCKQNFGPCWQLGKLNKRRLK